MEKVNILKRNVSPIASIASLCFINLEAAQNCELTQPVMKIDFLILKENSYKFSILYGHLYLYV